MVLAIAVELLDNLLKISTWQVNGLFHAFSCNLGVTRIVVIQLIELSQPGGVGHIATRRRLDKLEAAPLHVVFAQLEIVFAQFVLPKSQLNYPGCPANTHITSIWSCQERITCELVTFMIQG